MNSLILSRNSRYLLFILKRAASANAAAQTKPVELDPARLKEIERMAPHAA